MKKIVGVLITVIIILVAGFTIIKIRTEEDYEIEDVVNFSYFKLYENEKYGVIGASGNILVPAKYDLLEIPNPSKPVFIGYVMQNEDQYETEVINDKNLKILENYSRS